jgi:hypothetical protein
LINISIPQLEDFDSLDMTLYSCGIYTAIFPTHDASTAQPKNFLDIDVGMRRGWDLETGKPSQTKLLELDLEDIAQDL